MQFFLNGNKFNVSTGLSILQTCQSIGVSIPRFCFHEKLSVAGNCRMCLIESTQSPKPVASCAVIATETAHIFTNTFLVKQAREGILEFLLSNHPLDCPVCDQGGECDLQDQTLAFGSDRSRFYDTKRSVVDKDLGYFVKSVMTRCIHCTRCVRFSSEIAGDSLVGMSGRGSFSEIGAYLERLKESELISNVIDLCPVGALTAKPYAFASRKWELQIFNYVDIFDSMGSHIQLHVRGLQVIRVVPRLSEDLNQSWISERIRYGFEGLFVQRLDAPLLLSGHELIEVSWFGAAKFIVNNFNNYLVLKNSKFLMNLRFIGGVGSILDFTTIASFKEFVRSFVRNDLFDKIEILLEDCNQACVDFRSFFILSTKLPLLFQTGFLILLGLSPRLELPTVNVRMRAAVLAKRISILAIGVCEEITYNVTRMYSNMFSFFQFLEGKHHACLCLLMTSKVSFLVGSSIQYRHDYPAVQKILTKFLNFLQFKFNIVTFLHSVVLPRGALQSMEIGLRSNLSKTFGIYDRSFWDLWSKVGRILSLDRYKTFDKLHLHIKQTHYFNFFYLINYNDYRLPQKLFAWDEDDLQIRFHIRFKSKRRRLRNFINFRFDKNFIIYQGHLGDAGAAISNIVLPTASVLEKCSIFLNFVGDCQRNLRILSAPHLAKADQNIFFWLGNLMIQYCIPLLYFTKHLDFIALWLVYILPKSVYNYRLKIFSSSRIYFFNRSFVKITKNLNIFVTNKAKKQSTNILLWSWYWRFSLIQPVLKSKLFFLNIGFSLNFYKFWNIVLQYWQMCYSIFFLLYNSSSYIEGLRTMDNDLLSKISETPSVSNVKTKFSEVFFSASHSTTFCHRSLFSTIAHEHLSRDKMIWRNSPALRKLRKEITNFNF